MTCADCKIFPISKESMKIDFDVRNIFNTRVPYNYGFSMMSKDTGIWQICTMFSYN